MVINQGAQGLFMQQGDVTTKQQEITRKTVQGIFCTEQGVAGTKLFCLNGETQVLAGHGNTDLFSTMADHRNDRRGIESHSGLHHMAQKRLAHHPVQDLGKGRFHAGPLAGSQDYRG